MGVLIGALITKLVELFSKTFLHAAFKIAIALAFIALLIAAIYAYVSAAGEIINALSASVPEIVSGVWGWVMPGNTSACLVALSSAVLLRFFTNQYHAIMKMKFKTSISN
jgi:hypothetical protein